MASMGAWSCSRRRRRVRRSSIIGAEREQRDADTRDHERNGQIDHGTWIRNPRV